VNPISKVIAKVMLQGVRKREREMERKSGEEGGRAMHPLQQFNQLNKQAK
jgi:hypothetical protein